MVTGDKRTGKKIRFGGSKKVHTISVAQTVWCQWPIRKHDRRMDRWPDGWKAIHIYIFWIKQVNDPVLCIYRLFHKHIMCSLIRIQHMNDNREYIYKAYQLSRGLVVTEFELSFMSTCWSQLIPWVKCGHHWLEYNIVFLSDTKVTPIMNCWVWFAFCYYFPFHWIFNIFIL